MNVNGLGADSKKTQIMSLVEKDYPLLLGIQKTKMESLNHFLIYYFWNSTNCGFAFSDVTGSSGGMLTI